MTTMGSIAQVILSTAISLGIGSAAFAQAVPGPVPTPSQFIRGSCTLHTSTGVAYGVTQCLLWTPGVVYTGTGIPIPENVPLGKNLIIVDISVECKTPDGESTGIYVSKAELEANGYSKVLPLVASRDSSNSAVRVGTFPANLSARSGSTVRAVFYQTKLGPVSSCDIGFNAYLVNP